MTNGRLKKIYLFSKILLFFTVLLFLYILYLNFYPLKPVEYFLPYLVKTKIVKQGDNVIYTSKYCKKIDTNGRVSRTLVDKEGLTYYLDPTDGIGKTKGCGTVDVAVRIPKEIPPNTYVMKASVSYKINFLRTIVITSYTDKFEIVK